MKISKRGPVTIPKKLRDNHGFSPDTEVRIVVRDGALQIEKDPRARPSAVDRLYGAKQLGRSTDELMQLLRG